MTFFSFTSSFTEKTKYEGLTNNIYHLGALIKCNLCINNKMINLRVFLKCPK